eukprot:3665392-Amphidinium_carterae.1
MALSGSKVKTSHKYLGSNGSHQAAIACLGLGQLAACHVSTGVRTNGDGKGRAEAHLGNATAPP